MMLKILKTPMKRELRRKCVRELYQPILTKTKTRASNPLRRIERLLQSRAARINRATATSLKSLMISAKTKRIKKP
jgi:hypothetical protein